MKYLKLFEDNEYYTPISRSEFIHSYNNLSTFTDAEIESLRMRFNFKIEVSKDDQIILSKNRDTISIYKVEDEWFYVDLGNFFFEGSREGNDKIIHFYKCDQFEGLDMLIAKAVQKYILKKKKEANQKDFERKFNIQQIKTFRK
jgi:hypothetical protein